MTIEVEAFLEHHGVKGMKWGERRAKKKMDRAEKDWETRRVGGLLTPKEYIAVHNAAATKANAIDVPRINNKPEYKNADFRIASPLRDKYYAEHEKAFNDRMNEAFLDQHGTSPSGLRKVKINKDGSAQIVDARHADGDPEIKLEFDSKGHIVKIVVIDNTLEHFDVGEFLAHHGIKGMKWGQRRKRGANGLVSSESHQARQALAKAKKHGSKALTNKELADLNKRLQLERQFSQLTYKPGKSKVVADIIANTGKQQAQRALNDALANQIGKAMSGGTKKYRGKNKYKNFANDATMNAAK